MASDDSRASPRTSAQLSPGWISSSAFHTSKPSFTRWAAMRRADSASSDEWLRKTFITT